MSVVVLTTSLSISTSIQTAVSPQYSDSISDYVYHFWRPYIFGGQHMAAIISRVKRYLLLITFYLALWADINQNRDYKNNDTSHSELEHRSRHLACVNLPRFVLTTKVRTRASRFLLGRLQYTSKADSSFQIERHMLSGDISPNPGPGKKSCKPKYPCKECGKQVKSNQDAILCSSCGM